MRRLSLTFLVSLVLLGLLLAPTPSRAGAEAHPLIKRAIGALQRAKTDLQNAAHDYCGHRAEALEATNVALNQLQQALDCDSRRDRSTGAEIGAEPKSSGTSAGERHPNINRAIDALSAAEGDVQNAAHDYCGHRAAALDAVRSSLNQLRLAVECDKR